MFTTTGASHCTNLNLNLSLRSSLGPCLSLGPEALTHVAYE